MKYLIAIILLLSLELGYVTGSELSYSEIVSRLYDMKLLAEKPAAGEMSGNFSSGDKSAKYNDETGLYENWYSNNDGDGNYGREGGDIIAAEMEGPGVIWRVWSAMPEGGLMKVYIDGGAEPMLAVPFRDYFDSGREPFNYGELVRDNARGKNSYIPIVFQKSCKVVLCEGWGRYFQISWSKLAEGSKVSSFKGYFDEQEQAALRRADGIWASRKPVMESGGICVNKERVRIHGGEASTVAELLEPGAITGINISLPEMDSKLAEKVMREVVISIYWDGSDKAAVWSPLGDMFGSSPGVNTYHSLAMSMGEGKLESSWYMPYSSARVVLTNDGDSDIEFGVSMYIEKLSQAEADNLLRFHVKWHRDKYGAAGRERYMSDRWPDWPVLLVDGACGRFCGMALSLWNPLHMWDRERASKYKWYFPEGSGFVEGSDLYNFFKRDVIEHTYWWGEGDEKFFVDGEYMPSTFGTGSEDYFGYAWGTPQRFDSAVQCQTLNHENRGHISVCRWQISDNVPFNSRFEGCIEKYHDNNWPLRYAVTAYWYQQRGSNDMYEPVPVGKRLGYYAEPELR